MAVTIALLVFSILGLVIGDSVNSISSAATQSYCTVVAESSMTVHLVDESGKPIPNATILLNGTFSCQPAAPDSRLNQSGITDSNGNAWFGVIPYANYNVTVILPENMQSRTIILTQITAPMPTFSTTIDVACTPSADQCTIPAKSRNSISLQGVSLYTSTPATYPSPYLSAMIFANASAPLSSLHLFINGTDEGTTTYSNNTMTNYVIWFKAMPSNPAMPIIAGKIYNITLVAAFQDNSTFTASVSIVAAGAGTQTTSITTAPVPFLDFPATLIAILLGLFVVARRRRRLAEYS